MAPKEPDLMLFGSRGFVGRTPQEEEQLVYRGYGQVEVDPVALAYYRFERSVQDLAIYGDELIRQLGSAEDRAQLLGYIMANFAPGGPIERGYAVWRRTRGNRTAALPCDCPVDRLQEVRTGV